MIFATIFQYHVAGGYAENPFFLNLLSTWKISQFLGNQLPKLFFIIIIFAAIFYFHVAGGPAEILIFSNPSSTWNFFSNFIYLTHSLKLFFSIIVFSATFQYHAAGGPAEIPFFFLNHQIFKKFPDFRRATSKNYFFL